MNRLASMSKLIVFFVVLASWSLVKSGIMLIEGQSQEYQVNNTNANDLYQEFKVEGINDYESALWNMRDGDLIFVDYEGDGIADHVGVIQMFYNPADFPDPRVIHATNRGLYDGEYTGLDPIFDTLNGPYGYCVAYERLEWAAENRPPFWKLKFLGIGRRQMKYERLAGSDNPLTYNSNSINKATANIKEVILPPLYPTKSKPHTVLSCKYGAGYGEIKPLFKKIGGEVVPMGFTFMVDEDENIIIGDGETRIERFQIFDKNGELLKVVNRKDEEFSRLRKLGRFMPISGLVYRANNIGWKIPQVVIRVEQHSFNTVFINIYKVKRIDNRWKETGEILYKIKFKTPGDTLYSPILCIGMDADSNFYIAYSTKPSSVLYYKKGAYTKWKTWITKFSLNGDFRGSIQVERCMWYMGGYILISQAGHVYVCNTDKDSLWIVRYPAKMFDESIGK